MPGWYRLSAGRSNATATAGYDLDLSPRSIQFSLVGLFACGLLIALALWRSEAGLLWVRGTSMEPFLHSGDILFTVRPMNPRVGDIAVASLADGPVIKRLASNRSGVWFLAGESLDARDSRHYGPVGAEAIRALALFRLWPAPKLL